MPAYATISLERHGQKKWRRFEDYRFAAKEAVVPLAAGELAKAALAMPCAFVQQSGTYTLVAVLSLAAGRNMFVGPDGRWFGSYIPAYMRFYPFRALPQQGSADKLVLCVDEDSGLVIDGSAGGEEFFEPEGKPSATLKPIADALMQIERNRRATDVAVAALAQAGVIKPWNINLQAEKQRPISGLHCVDEAALAGVSDDALLKLRAASSLPIAYAQMLSAGQFGVFHQLARLHGQVAAPPPIATLPETLDGLLENLKGDLFRLGGS
jgi:hypothetical protein